MSLPSELQPARTRQMLLIWWIVWAAILVGLVLIYVVLGRGPVQPSPVGDVFRNLVGVVPLFVSVVIRWLVLPRYTDLTRAFPAFVVGLALAEGCGILGIFLGGAYRDDLFLLGVLAVTQYVPLFAGRLLRRPDSNFTPNN